MFAAPCYVVNDDVQSWAVGIVVAQLITQWIVRITDFRARLIHAGDVHGILHIYLWVNFRCLWFGFWYLFTHR